MACQILSEQRHLFLFYRNRVPIKQKSSAGGFFMKLQKACILFDG